MRYPTILHALRAHSARTPGKLAFTFSSGASAIERVTFADLHRAVTTVARGLRGEPTPVLLLLKPGVDFIAGLLGCAAAGHIPIPVMNPQRLPIGAARLLAVARDSGARLGLTHASLLPTVQDLARSHPVLAAIEWRTVAPAGAAIDDPVLDEPAADAIAFIQYTSGSTREPKGVVVSHANVVSNVEAIASATAQTADSVFAGWLPPYHDMGLVGLILTPLYLGATCHLMPPVDMLRRPSRWLRLLADVRATATAAPAFALDLCAARTDLDELKTIDLRALEVLIVGAEPVLPSSVETFVEHLSVCGFLRRALVPSYGLAESTLFVSGTSAGGVPRSVSVDDRALARGRVVAASPASVSARRVMSCGRPAPGTEILIVNPRTRRPCVSGRAGEIWVRGASVAQGYWRRDRLSERAMRAASPVLAGKYLRTGDLGFFEDGELFVIGRRDDQLVIRGRNVQPADLERTSGHGHPATVHPGAIALPAPSAAPGVIIIQEIRAAPSQYRSIAAAIRRAVARRHDIEVHAVLLCRPRALPRTASGKLRRRACREALSTGRLHVLYSDASPEGTPELEAGRTDPESIVRASAAAVAHVPPSAVDVGMSLIDLGCDSLGAVRFQHRIQQRYGHTLDLSAILRGATLRQLAVDLGGVRPSGPELRSRARETVALGPGQRELWFESERNRAPSAYHLGRALALHGDVDVAALRSAFDRVAARHAVLQSTIVAAPEGLSLRRQDGLTASVVECDATHWSEEELRRRLDEEFNAPFDLTRDAPVRVRMYNRTAAPPIVLLVVHHIAADFRSLELIADEWFACYEELLAGVQPSSAPPRRTYPDFLEWHETAMRSAEGRRFWEEQLRTAPPPLEWLLPRPAPAPTNYAGRATRALDGALAGELADVARAHGVTRFMLVLAALAVLLARYTQQDDLCVGVPVSLRTPAFDDVAGFFVSTVVVRCRPVADVRFADFLASVSGTVAGALQHATVPLSEIARAARTQGRADDTPLFQVMLVDFGSGRNERAPFVLDIPDLTQQWGDLAVDCIPVGRPPLCDLWLGMADHDGVTYCTAEYDRRIFDVDVANRLLGHLEMLLKAIVASPSSPLRDLEMLTEAERHRFDHWNETLVRFDQPHVLHELVTAQRARTPNAEAIRASGRRLTFAELDDAATGVAASLVERGVSVGTRVAVLLDPGADMVIALLAVLKAGGAYVPLDPDDGEPRLDALLDHVAPAALITTSAKAERLRTAAAIHCVEDAGWGAPVRTVSGLPSVEPGDVAYVIYTSGSTGSPKGVMVSHRAICNRLLWMRDRYGVAAPDCILAKTPYVFDVSVWELFLGLIAGAQTVIARPGGHRDPAYLASAIREAHVTIVHFVPSMLRVFLEEPHIAELPIRCLFVSGEALGADLRDRCLARMSGELHNLYGPTEAAVDVTAWDCRSDPARDPVPIGRPIANVQAFVMDAAGSRLPVHIAGELCLAGVALAEGYWREPQHTASQFVRRTIAGRDIRMYRTGDLARYRDDGTLDFVGRIDDQVKVSGVRVEPAEVERVLRQHPAVADGIVVAWRGDGDTRLAGYVISRGPFDAEQVKAFVRERVPAAFVPAVFTTVDAWPRTPTGKIDRKALPPPSAAVSTSGDRDGDSADATEIRLREIWRAVLGVPSVGPNDNFFFLGGDSLRVLQVRARARTAGLDVSVEDVFSAPTVRSLARRVRVINHVPCARTQPFGLVSAEARARLPRDLEDAFPLTKLQEVLVFHSTLDQDYETYVLSVRVRLVFRRQPFEETLAWITARHEMLRASFELGQGDEYVQCVHPTATIPLEVCDLTACSAAEQDSAVAEYIERERSRRFDWARAPLLRIRVDRLDEHVVQITVSHPMFDGWSLTTVLTEMLQEYLARVGGASADLGPPPSVTFGDFVALERAALASTVTRQFWADVLRSSTTSPLPRRRTAVATPRRARRGFPLDDQVALDLRQLARSLHLPLKSVLLAAHLRVARLLTGQTTPLTGLITNGRIEEGDGERAVGLFLNAVPLPVEIGDGSWAELARRVFDAEQRVWPHRRFPLAELRAMSGANPFDIAFNFIHFHVYEAVRDRSDVQILDWTNPSDFTYFPLCAYFNDDPVSGRLLAYLDYDGSYLTDQEADAVVEYYGAALRQMTADPHASVAGAPLFVPDLRLAPGITELVPVHEQIAARASASPTSTAVCQGSRQLSYGEMMRRALRTARVVAELNEPGAPVGICLDRSVNTVVALLAVMYSGAPFVPLSPTLAPERLRTIVGDCGIRVVLLEDDGEWPSTAPPVNTVRIAEDSLVDEARGRRASRDDLDALAYVIYTSGSTGVPKGVEITHAALANVLAAIGAAVEVSPGDRWLSVTSLSFDIAILELLLPLCVGASVHIAEATEVRSADRLTALLDRVQATIMQATPSMWRLLIEGGWSGANRLRAICGGEALSRGLADQLLALTGRAWNVYGPTETAIWTTIASITAGTDDPAIGRPLANTAAIVLDGDLAPVPPGTPGELCIAGVGLARGYRGRAELTRQRFVDVQFGGGPAIRVYCTGDRVCVDAADGIRWLGRIDTQVKVRGVRMELEEIESLLRERPEIDEAVVLAEPRGEDVTLVAYVTCRRGSVVSSPALRAHLARMLPAQMIPSAFVPIRAFPLNANGKIDRAAVRTLRPAAVAPASMAALPSHVQAVLTIFREMLDPSAEADDSFFALGGHSLLAMRACARIEKALGVGAPVDLLFSSPTARSFADRLIGRHDDAGMTGERRLRMSITLSDMAARRRAVKEQVHAPAGE